MAPPLIFGEKKQAVVRVMRFMIGFLTVAFVLFAYLIHSIWEIAFLLGIFFIGFNVLEATLPNLVSRIAPAADRGLALGVYNTTQNIGLFVGGALGGAISQHFGRSGLLRLCICYAYLVRLIVWAAGTCPSEPRARRSH